jgi:hypothetical protein
MIKQELVLQHPYSRTLTMADHCKKFAFRFRYIFPSWHSNFDFRNHRSSVESPILSDFSSSSKTWAIQVRSTVRSKGSPCKTCFTIAWWILRMLTIYFYDRHGAWSNNVRMARRYLVGRGRLRLSSSSRLSSPSSKRCVHFWTALRPVTPFPEMESVLREIATFDSVCNHRKYVTVLISSDIEHAKHRS